MGKIAQWVEKVIRVKRLSMSFDSVPEGFRARYRLLEMVPGGLIWATFVCAIVLSFVAPLLAVYFIILFDLLWLVRIFYFLLYLAVGWRRFRNETRTDWNALLVRDFPHYPDYYHLVVLPFYKEPVEVLRHSLEGLRQSTYPLDRIMIVLAGEDRAGEHALIVQRMMHEEFGNIFFRMFCTIHHDAPNEIRGKSANLTAAMRQVVPQLAEIGIVTEKVIVSVFDADTRAPQQYFARLMHAFLSQPDPLRCSYQPLVTFNNNFWESFTFSRIVAYSTTLWHMTELARPPRLFFTYSSHALPLKALIDVGFWEVDMVNEDSRIFFQCFIHYNGEYRVVPLYVPVSLDVVDAGTFWNTVKNQYKQILRWGYGAEHFPYLVMHYWKNTKIPLFMRVKHIFFAAEGSFSWATMPILITLLGYVPLKVLEGEQYSSLLAQRAPFILEGIMRAGMVGMVFSILLMFQFLPPKPAGYRWWKYGEMVLQWALLPVTMILFGSIPSTDAQTRLMLGKYMGFWNTDKTRKGA